MAEYEQKFYGGVVLSVAPNTKATSIEASELAVQQLVGQTPQRQDMFGLAGPNETVQILLDSSLWLSLVYVIGGGGKKFAEKIAERLADDAYDFVKKKLFSRSAKDDETVDKFIKAIRVASANGDSVIFGYRANIGQRDRNIGLEFSYNDNLSDDEIKDMLTDISIALANIGGVLAQEIDKLPAGYEVILKYNSDISVAMSLAPNGDITVFLKGPNSQPLEFDARGKKKS